MSHVSLTHRVELVERDTHWAQAGTIVDPNPATRDTYVTLYETFGALYPSPKAAVHLLARMQEEQAAR